MAQQPYAATGDICKMVFSFAIQQYNSVFTLLAK